MAEDKLAELVKWPTEEKDVTVDLILRCIGADTQRTLLEKWAAIEKDRDHFRTPAYVAQVQQLVSGVGLMACLRALRQANPAYAEMFARHYWSMCESGDAFGELLWQFLEEAGLDPELIKL